MKIENIQVGIDFSRASNLALEHGRSLALRLGAELTLQHAFYMPRPLSAFTDTDLVKRSGRWADIALEIRSERMKELAALADELNSGEINAFTAFDDGEPSSVLLATEGRARRDLLVVGHRGTNPMSRLLVGSVAETIASRSRRPVLFVKAPPKPSGFGHVVVATHLTGHQQEEIQFATMLGSSDASIEIVHALQTGAVPFGMVGAHDKIRSFIDETRDLVVEQLESVIASMPNVGSQELTATCLLAPPRNMLFEVCSQDRGVDLLVIGRRAARQRLGSLALWALRHLPCSVLIVPDPQQDKLFDDDSASPQLASNFGAEDAVVSDARSAR